MRKFKTHFFCEDSRFFFFFYIEIRLDASGLSYASLTGNNIKMTHARLVTGTSIYALQVYKML
jgi:hypothetical protein